MKKNISLILVLLVLMLGLGLVSGCGNEEAVPTSEKEVKVENLEQEMAPDLYGMAAAEADQELTVEEMLTYAIQDEYLAHGEYAFILETFGSQNPFNNIIKAEEQHIASLKSVFQAQGMTIPEDLSGHYLIVPASVEEALETGVQAEIDNIAMYERFLKEPLPEDVKALFISLRDGSINHLAAFEGKL